MRSDNGVLGVEERLAGVRALIASEDAPTARQSTGKDLWIGHPRPEESLPEELSIPLPKRDYRWVWVAYVDGEAVAALYATDFHGIVFLSAIKAMKAAGSVIVMRLLREVARSCRRRGLTHFMTFLDTNTASGLKMLRIMQRMTDVNCKAEAGAWASALIPSKKGWS